MVSRDWTAAARAAQALLQELESSPQIVRAAAHPLGFVHMLLHERADGSRVRLHLWPNPPYKPQHPWWPVHQHPGPLRSLVVQGRILNRQYEVHETAEGPYELYTAGYAQDSSILRPTGRQATCTLRSTCASTGGEVYEIESEAFHASEAELPSVTIVEAAVSTGRVPLVVGAPANGVMSYRRRTLAAADLVELIRSL